VLSDKKLLKIRHKKLKVLEADKYETRVTTKTYFYKISAKIYSGKHF